MKFVFKRDLILNFLKELCIYIWILVFLSCVIIDIRWVKFFIDSNVIIC